MDILNEMNTIRNNVQIIKQFAEIPEFAVLKDHMFDMIDDINTEITDYENKVFDVIKESEYYKRMKEILPSFSQEFEALFIMVLRDFDLGPLEFMLNTMEGISTGKIDKDKGEMCIGEHLAEKFIKQDSNSHKSKSKRKRMSKTR